MTTTPEIEAVCQELRSLQRARVHYSNTLQKLSQRRLSIIVGYLAPARDSADEESHKAKLQEYYEQAGTVLKDILSGASAPPYADLIAHHTKAMVPLESARKEVEKSMLKRVRALPVYDWCQHADQKGFGEMGLATVVGECGNLANYANPGKLWRRLGCAPYTARGVTQLCSTWKSKKPFALTAEEWTDAGYSPRRRAIAYLIGKWLMSLNKPGPYRRLYDEAKAKALARPDWMVKGKPSKQHADRHAMLMAAKRLLRNLWREWNGNPPGAWPE